MSDYIGDRIRETGTYDPANDRILLEGAVSNARTVLAGLNDSASVDADGKNIELTIQHIDKNLSGWECSSWIYNSVGDYIIRDEVKSSSSGTSLINFDESAGAVVVYSTTSHDVFGVRTLQSFYIDNGGDFTNSALTDVAVSDVVEITPNLATSYLDIAFTTDTRISGTATNEDINGSVMLQFQNNTGAWVDLGFRHNIGHVNVTASAAAPIVYCPIDGKARLNQSATILNAEKWKVRLIGRVDSANLTLTQAAVSWLIEEKV